MEENNITNIEETKKDNKTIKIVLYVIIFIIAATCIVLASNGIDLRNDNDSEYELVDDHDEEEQEEQEQPEEEEPEQEKDPEFPNHIDIDAALKNLKIEVTNEDKFNLISSSNVQGYMSDQFLGEMYKEQISDQYKLLYTISFLHNKMNEASIDYYGDNAAKKIKKETLLNYAKMLFNEVNIPSNLDNSLHYAFNANLTCYQEICTYTSEVTGITAPISNGYEVNTYDRGDQVIVDAFYVEYNNEEFKDYDYNYIYADITLKDKYNGKELKNLTNYKLQISSDTEELDDNHIFLTLGSELDEIPRYTFKFNDKNVLLSVEQG